jgi:hypothetical protein
MADPHEGRGNNEATSGRKEKDKEGDEEIERFSSGGRVAASSSSSHPGGKLKQLPTPLLKREYCQSREPQDLQENSGRGGRGSVYLEQIPSVTVTVVAAVTSLVTHTTCCHGLTREIFLLSLLLLSLPHVLVTGD